MNTSLKARVALALSNVQQRLLAELKPEGYWEGHLSSSALSTSVAILALAQIDHQRYQKLIEEGFHWLAAHIEADGGWGDAPGSPANLSTTLLCWSAFSHADPVGFSSTIEHAVNWLRRCLGRLEESSIADAVIRFYGNDRTFSAPILTVCALSGRLGKSDQAWARVPQLPFELALFPSALFKWLRLSVVSYAIPALIAIGLVRHHHARRRWSMLAHFREWIRPQVLTVLARIQPASGGFLEATPLTGFVALGLAGAGLAGHPVTQKCCQFLEASVRPDGSWPIDTNLATWVTTLAINNQDLDGTPLSIAQRESARQWLLSQQYQMEHPYTHAEPGGWAWTDLSGGVPDADDTSGVLLALKKLGDNHAPSNAAALMGIDWLLNMQNRDGGMPTFCRGWGQLPFDRSCPDITAHALSAFMAWRDQVDAALQSRIDDAIKRALNYLRRAQNPKGAWIPLWFGNQEAPGHLNPIYGTAQVILALSLLHADRFQVIQNPKTKGCQWLVSAQNSDGGWGGDAGVKSSIEETALATRALAQAESHYLDSAERGLLWLLNKTKDGTEMPPVPIGLYFASLWYYEKLYPLIFSLGAFTVFSRNCACASHQLADDLANPDLSVEDRQTLAVTLRKGRKALS